MWHVKLLAKLSQNIQAMTCSVQNAKTQSKDPTLLCGWLIESHAAMPSAKFDKVLNASGRDKRFYVKSRQQKNPLTPHSQPWQLLNSDKTICNSRIRWPLPSGNYCRCQWAIYDADTEGTKERMQRNNAQPALHTICKIFKLKHSSHN